MKKRGILNKELNDVIASMGHTDRIIISDVGFPIPEGVRRVDLALTDEIPDTETVLKLIEKEVIAEEIYVAEDVFVNNKPLYESIQSIFEGVNINGIPHEDILTKEAHKAKAVVRTGSYNPWGNIVLQSGVDVKKFFNRSGVVTPDYYKDKM
ncbi:D-ribose pyranase [Oceanobacillus jeddahense]|uniref:D-ribose pyranase n=1 Tax=Oceanobacillus jeddahense TaxID=1462527 RepID=A0ABY5JT71_9BACI|nr:D-ribose pyranase [Oceanobacillus jeddahense]UUI02989.1 D-ribose pyranase [Oceanobacillus jeddahense]